MVGLVTQEDRQRVSFSPVGVRIETVQDGRPSKFVTIFQVERAALAPPPSSGGGQVVAPPRSGGGALRPAEGAAGGDGGRIFRVEVNGFKRTYVRESLAERAARNEAAREAIEERLRKQREEAGPGATSGLLGLLAGAGPGSPGAPGQSRMPVEVKKTDELKAIAGRRCRKYEFFRDGDRIFEGWYTEAPAPAWVRRFDFDEAPGGEDAPLTRARKSVKGLELESVLFLPAGGRRTVTTTKVVRKRLPASFFEPPDDYRGVEPAGAAPAGGGARK
jgi:hypothetical protein